MRETRYLKDNIHNIEQLISIPTFREIETRTLGEILKISKIRTFGPEEVIIAEKEIDPWIYFLLEGHVEVLKAGKRLASLRRVGDVFGEIAMLQGTRRSASVKAVSSTTCLCLDSSRITELPEDDRVAFGYILFRMIAVVLAEHLQQANHALVEARETIETFQGRQD